MLKCKCFVIQSEMFVYSKVSESGLLWYVLKCKCFVKIVKCSANFRSKPASTWHDWQVAFVTIAKHCVSVGVERTCCVAD